MRSRHYDIVIIGSGIVGLATAMTLERQYPRVKVAVLEKEAEVGLHQTGHNSGVIHAGIYYAPGSQKANFCSTGGQMLRRFCDEHGVEYEMCGKVIVAVDKLELPLLEELRQRGVSNGAAGLEIVDRQRLQELEPHAAGFRAIFSPNTGIVDYRKVADAMASDVQEGGGELLTGTAVLQISRRGGAHYLETTKGYVSADNLINCAGLQADLLTRRMGLKTGLRIIPFRGEFFSLRPERADLVRGLIYPVPDPRLPFLGVHFTKRINGSVEAGPNAVVALAREGYRRRDLDLGEVMDYLTYIGFWRMSMKNWKNGLREQYRSLVKGVFVRSLQRLVPEITKDDLYQASSGVRAQAVNLKGELVQDFSIVTAPGSIHVLNAPSPAATASMAISRHIVELARESFELKE